MDIGAVVCGGFALLLAVAGRSMRKAEATPYDTTDLVMTIALAILGTVILVLGLCAS